GRGAGGAPGAMYFAILGSTSNPPTLTSSNASFYYGDSSSNQAELTVRAEDSYRTQISQGVYEAASVTSNGLHNDKSRGNPNLLESFSKIQFLNGEIAPEPDLPEYSAKPSA